MCGVYISMYCDSIETRRIVRIKFESSICVWWFMFGVSGSLVCVKFGMGRRLDGGMSCTLVRVIVYN